MKYPELNSQRKNHGFHTFPDENYLQKIEIWHLGFIQKTMETSSHHPTPCDPHPIIEKSGNPVLLFGPRRKQALQNIPDEENQINRDLKIWNLGSS